MGDIALRGNKLTKGRGPHGHGPKPFLNRPGQAQGTHGGKAKGGRIGKFGGGRTNLLEELGRVEAEPSNRNRRAEISRVHGELNRGYAKGGRIGLKNGGKPWGTGPKPGTIEFFQSTTQTPKRKRKAVGGVARGAQKAADTFIERVGGSEKGKPHSTRAGRISAGVRKIKRGAKKAAEPFVKESIWLDKLRKRKLGPRAGKGRPKAGPQAPSRPKKTWPPKHSDLLRRFPKMPQPHKSPGDKPYIPNPRRKLPKPGEPNIVQPAATGGRIGFKKGGSDKNWIQKAVNPKHKGFCTPMTKKTCTPRRKALARTFKKMGRERKAKG